MRRGKLIVYFIVFNDFMSLDFVLVIRADRVDVYCNPYNYPIILPYVAHWRRLHIHCMSNEEVQFACNYSGSYNTV